jgi:mannose-6-phosphate isomerase-like protein (cupin superfamily)
MTEIIRRADWATHPDHWQGEIELGAFGGDVCIIFNYIAGPGGGPRLHMHPYAETFIIRSGTGLFTLGDREIIARAGQILIAPAHVPHKFSNAGPGPFETIDIHSSGRFVTEWLE